MKTVPLKVLFENDRFIAVDKDAGIAVHGGQTIDENDTLLQMVKDHLGNDYNGFVAPAHRLDRNTRGPVLFAKDPETAKQLRRIFARGEVSKTYSALLEGKVTGPVFIEGDILKVRTKAVLKNTQVRTENIPSKKDWLAAKDRKSPTFSGTLILPREFHDDTTLCDIETWSGRYHQIRAVCEHIGHPVCGDKKYNHDPRNHYKRTTNSEYPDGQMLLCRTLEIESLGMKLTSGFELKAANGKEPSTEMRSFDPLSALPVK